MHCIICFLYVSLHLFHFSASHSDPSFVFYRTLDSSICQPTALSSLVVWHSLLSCFTSPHSSHHTLFLHALGFAFQQHGSLCNSRPAVASFAASRSLRHNEWSSQLVTESPLPSPPPLSMHCSDFNYQQTTEMRPPIEILPGDSIKTTCIWDSSRKAKVRAGGNWTGDEAVGMEERANCCQPLAGMNRNTHALRCPACTAAVTRASSVERLHGA